MIDRNVLMIDSMKEKLPSLIGDPSKQSSKGKMTKPEDLVRFVLTSICFPICYLRIKHCLKRR